MSTITAEIAHTLDLAEQYLSGWQKKDLKRIGNLLHPEVNLKSPVADLVGREAFLEMCEKIFPMLEEVKVRARFASETQVMLAYDFILRDRKEPVRTANLMSFQGNLIRSVELFFDARPFAEAEEGTGVKPQLEHGVLPTGNSES